MPGPQAVQLPLRRIERRTAAVLLCDGGLGHRDEEDLLLEVFFQIDLPAASRCDHVLETVEALRPQHGLLHHLGFPHDDLSVSHPGKHRQHEQIQIFHKHIGLRSPSLLPARPAP